MEISYFFSWLYKKTWKQSNTSSITNYQFFDLLDKNKQVYIGIGPTDLSPGDVITQFNDSTLAVAIRSQRFGGRRLSVVGSVALFESSASAGSGDDET